MTKTLEVAFLIVKLINIVASNITLGIGYVTISTLLLIIE